jgi:uncharacterized protein (DUF58 family)
MVNQEKINGFYMGQMKTEELIRKVRKIEIKTRRISEQLFSGAYHSAFKGIGMSFSEVRPYSYGDDWRHLDWNVTARTGQPHVKVYEEERELCIMLLVDISGSTFSGSNAAFRADQIAEICAVLSFSAMLNNDKVGMILFSDKIEKYIPPAKGKRHALRMLRDLLDVQSAGRSTDISVALEYIARVQKKKAICFLISDMYSPDFSTALKICSRKHDLIGLWCRDLLDISLPDMGLIMFEDPENGRKMWLDTSDKKFNNLYVQQQQAGYALKSRLFREAGASLVTIPSDDSYLKELTGFFNKRSSKHS